MRINTGEEKKRLQRNLRVKNGQETVKCFSNLKVINSNILASAKISKNVSVLCLAKFSVVANLKLAKMLVTLRRVDDVSCGGRDDRTSRKLVRIVDNGTVCSRCVF